MRYDEVKKISSFSVTKRLLIVVVSLRATLHAIHHLFTSEEGVEGGGVKGHLSPFKRLSVLDS